MPRIAILNLMFIIGVLALGFSLGGLLTKMVTAILKAVRCLYNAVGCSALTRRAARPGKAPVREQRRVL